MKTKLLALAITLAIILAFIGVFTLMYYYPFCIKFFMGLSSYLFCYAIYKIVLKELNKK
jgi:hypothetical protein